MGRIDILSRRLAREQTYLQTVLKRIKDTEGEIAEWHKNREYLERRRKIRDVGRDGWYLYVCTRGHESRYLSKDILKPEMSVCWEEGCDHTPNYVGRDPATKDEIVNWRREGYLPKIGRSWV